MDTTILDVMFVILALVIGVGIGYILRKSQAEKKIGSAEELAIKMVNEANREADTKKKEALLEAKDEIHRLRSQHDEEVRQRRSELQKSESRLIAKEENLDQRSAQIDRKTESLDRQSKKLVQKEQEIDELIEQQKTELERISNLTAEEAKELLLNEVRKEAFHESAAILREFESQVKEESEKKAREIISVAIQRYAGDQVAESTVTVVNLPNDEMKGRIIGREGRNIRAFETMTGVDLIIDDTPEAVVVSCFDPVRREIARITLERLIQDGRIHPTRIEDMFAKATDEVNQSIKEAGEAACDEANVHGLHPELVKTLGRMKYRTSYGQNALKHSIEVSILAGMMAQELGANVKVAKRGGLLHDLGKAIDHEVEGPHVELGVNLARKFKESKEVIHCIESHHDDTEPTTVEAVLVQAADTLSAARPGARRESVENYVKRLESLEAIANSFEGIDKSYAIQAGRELRIMVKPDKISEDQMTIIAHEIAKRIEDEMEYPGQIRVNVIRETRAQDIAK